MRRLATLVLAVVVGVAVGAAVFAFWHSGSRGEWVCNREGNAGPGTLSFWPPGTHCEGGEPIVRSVDAYPLYVLVSLAAGLAACGLVVAARCWRPRPGHAA